MGKKKKQLKKDRFQYVKVEVSNNDINPQTGNVEVIIDMNFIKNQIKVINNFTKLPIANKSLISGYKGENKDRITSEIYTIPNDHSFNFRLKLEKYKHIVAIDTNSTTFYSKVLKTNLSIGLGMAFVLLENNEQHRIEPINIPFITNFNCEKPENENWIRVIETLKQNCQCTDERKIGIVVDSDLGNLSEYNNRLKPIFQDYYLPDEYELVFASDKVKDNILNVMISECHKLSQHLLPTLIRNLEKTEQDM